MSKAKQSLDLAIFTIPVICSMSYCQLTDHLHAASQK